MKKRRRIFEDDPDWTVREHLNTDTGKFTYTYYFKNRRCNRFFLTSRLAVQLAGNTLIEKDLRNIIKWLSKYLPYLSGFGEEKYHKSPGGEDYDTVKGLFVAAVTFYGKCFTQCEGRKTQLKKRDIKDEKMRKTHDLIMSYRHNFTAHSRKEKIELTKVSLVFDSKKSRNTPPNIATELTQPDSFNKEDVEKFIELVDCLQDLVLKRIDKIKDKILKEECEQGKLEHWYKKAKKLNG